MCTDLFEAGEEPFKPRRIANLCAIRKGDAVEMARWLKNKVEAKLTAIYALITPHARLGGCACLRLPAPACGRLTPRLLGAGKCDELSQHD